MCVCVCVVPLGSLHLQVPGAFWSFPITLMFIPQSCSKAVFKAGTCWRPRHGYALPNVGLFHNYPHFVRFLETQ